MTTAATSLLGLALPVTGELSGTWGDTVNNSITSLVDSAIAGTTTLSTDADVTLTTTTLAANQAREAILLWTASGTVTRNITAPAQSKAYIVINATGSTQSIVLRGAGPTTGVTLVAGEKALCSWNGSDFVKIATTATASSFSAGTTGFTPSTATTGAITLAGTLGTANGGTGLTSFTSGGAVYASSTSALTTGTLPVSAGGTGGSTASITLFNNITGFTAAGTTGTTSTNLVFSTSPTLVTPVLGTPTSVTLTNGTGLPLTTGVTGTLPIANGGTGATTLASASIATYTGTETLTNKTLTNPTVTNYVESVVSIGNSGTSQTLALTNGTVQTVTMTGNCTFTMPTNVAGKSFILICTQDATGSRTATFTSVKWPSGTAPTLTTTASTGRDILTFVADGTNWYGTYAQAFA